MEISRKIDKGIWQYHINGSPHITGASRFTLGFLFQTMTVQSNFGNKLCLRQTNLVLQIFDKIPVIGWFVHVPFKVYVDEGCVGRSKKKYRSSIYMFSIKRDNYELSLHKQNKVALLKNGKQIALYQRKEEVWLERSTYFVQHSGNVESDILLLFSIFADRVLFSTSRNQLAVYRWEKMVPLGDKHPERGEWKPPENEEVKGV